MCSRRDLKVSADKRKVMVLGGKEGSICEIFVWEFKYLRCVLNENGTDGAECCRKVLSRKNVVSAIISLVNAWSLQFEYVRVMYEALFVPVLLYEGMRENLGLGLCRWKTLVLLGI